MGPGTSKGPTRGAGGPWSSVELRGFEPRTFSLRTRRATNCATAPWCGPHDNTRRRQPRTRSRRGARGVTAYAPGYGGARDVTHPDPSRVVRAAPGARGERVDLAAAAHRGGPHRAVPAAGLLLRDRRPARHRPASVRAAVVGAPTAEPGHAPRRGRRHHRPGHAHRHPGAADPRRVADQRRRGRHGAAGQRRHPADPRLRPQHPRHQRRPARGVRRAGPAVAVQCQPRLTPLRRRRDRRALRGGGVHRAVLAVLLPLRRPEHLGVSRATVPAQRPRPTSTRPGSSPGSS